MDLYRGQFDFVNFSTQVHDFNPGIHPFPSGLFWTVRLPNDSVSVDLGEGKATYHASSLRLTDFFTIPNSLNNGALAGTSPATVSFQIHWSGANQRHEIHDEALQVAGLFVDTGAAIEWSAHSEAEGFAFKSDSAGQTVVFAQVAQERNGVFFS